MKKRIIQQHSFFYGFTLVEVLVYIALLVVITLLTINTILSFTSSYRDLQALRAVDHSGTDVLEAMTRSIRGAGSVDGGQSILNSNPGSLAVVAIANGISTTTAFYIDNGVLKESVNGVEVGPLTLSNVSVDNLMFTELDSGNSQAIKIDLTMTGTSGPVSKTKNFYTTVIMRGSLK